MDGCNFVTVDASMTPSIEGFWLIFLPFKMGLTLRACTWMKTPDVA